MIRWLMSYPHWDVVAWLILFGVGGVLEGLGIANKHFSTFTAFVRLMMPWWVRLPFWLWLGFHFLYQK